MKIGFIQYDVSRTPQENIDKLEKFMSCRECDTVLMPELSMSGYLFENRSELMNCAENVPEGTSTQTIIDLSKKYSRTVIFGIAEKDSDNIYNTAVVVSCGKYIGKYRKIHLSDLEKKFFDRGEENRVFTVNGINIGVQICFDLWFPEVSREQIRMGADILFVLANFGGDTTYRISELRAVENLTPLVLCNRIGKESVSSMDAEFLGKSTAVDACGKRIVTAEENKEYFGVCDIEIPEKKAYVICGDFDSEIAIHYPKL